jgi:hypothetical protein
MLWDIEDVMLGVFVPVRVAVELSDVDTVEVGCTGEASSARFSGLKAPAAMGNANHGLPPGARDKPHAQGLHAAAHPAREGATKGVPARTVAVPVLEALGDTVTDDVDDGEGYTHGPKS